MNWQISWSRRAENDLALLWICAENRSEVSACARELDRQLRADPLHAGESRPDGTRLAYELPIAIAFEVFEADRRAIVYRVWSVRRVS